MLNEKINSFLMIGQSNMAGRGNIADVAPIDNDLCYMLRMGMWIKMSEPINIDAPVFGEGWFSGISMAASFADELSKCTNKQIGLIPCAVGGTKIKEWMPGEILFDNAVMNAKLAMRTSNLSGILWHQGENDCGNDENVSLYKQRFLTLAESLRKELGKEDIPIIIGEISEDITEKWKVGNRPGKLNAILNEIAKEVPYCHIASSKGLTLKSDGIHFDAASCRILGKRYSDEFLNIKKGE